MLANPRSFLEVSLNEEDKKRAVERLRDHRVVQAGKRLAELTASTYVFHRDAGVVYFKESGDFYSLNDLESISWNDMKKIPVSDLNRCFFISFMEHASLVPNDAAEHLKSLYSYVDRLTAAAPISGDQLCIPWQPLTAARRLINLLCALALILERDPALGYTGEFEFLLRHVAVLQGIVAFLQEDDLGYNHLASQLFARSLYAFVFSSSDTMSAECARFIACVEKQVGADGMQMERSPTYQAHVLGHLDVFRAGGLATGSLAVRLDELAGKMQSALAVMTHPSGQIAVLNDAAIGDGPSPRALGAHPGGLRDSVTILQDAGFARLDAGAFAGIFDAGPCGSDDNPGHAHADFLSLDLSVGGQQLFADPGVATYKKGAERDWTRSASTHNGPAFAGLEPIEFLGPFRVGRRGKAHFLPCPNLEVRVQSCGWLDGYDRFGGRVARWVGMWRDSAAMIVDVWRGLQKRAASSSFLIPESWEVRTIDLASAELSSRQNGAMLTISVINGTLTADRGAKYFPYGPRVPKVATRLTVKPASGGTRRGAGVLIRHGDFTANTVNFQDMYVRCEAFMSETIRRLSS